MKLRYELYSFFLEVPLHQINDLLCSFGYSKGSGAGRLLVKAQRLARDMRDPRKLAIRKLKKLLRAGRQRLMVSEEIQEIGDGLKRVVDLVRDGRRQTSRSRQLFRAA